MKTCAWYLFTLISLALGNALLAQGTAFTYQGLLNASGAPANGSYDLRFVVYDNNVGGSQQGPVLTNSATAVSNGLFTVTLDFGTNFPGAARWLEIGARTNGNGTFITLSPRQPLTPSPYAITAGNVAPGAGLSGTYGGAVTLSNSANQLTGTFVGNGANLTDVNAATLGGQSASNYWQLGGNNVASGQILGSTNNQALELWANGQRGLRLESRTDDANHSNIVNVVSGSSANFVAPGISGATISGGGGGRFFGFFPISNSVTGDFGTVGGGGENTSGLFATVGGGINNNASNNAATIGGGNGNTAGGQYATVGGGSGNIASGPYATVGGGFNNIASNAYATVSGWANIATGQYTAIGGGSFNTASGGGSTVGGGNANSASGFLATIPGGFNNSAAGTESFAAGRNAVAGHDGTFVWGDYHFDLFGSTSSNQFLIRASGGVGVGTNAPVAALHVASPSSAPEFQITQQNSSDSTRLRMSVSGFPSWEMDVSPGSTPQLQFWNNTLRMYLDYNGNLTTGGTVSATSFNTTSDRNLKENFSAVSSRDVLDKVAALPISRWNFKDDKATEHLGPMAQDFYAAFSVGPDDKHIATVDEGGVALAAIQGLNQKLDERDAEIKQLKEKADKVASLEKQNASLATRLNELEAAVKALAESK